MDNKYSKIADYIKEEIHSGNLKPGNKVPSIIDICKSFKCSKSTAIRAYEELQKQHLLYSISKSGFYVVENDLVKQESHDFLIDFYSASPDASLLPYEEFQHSINQAIRIYKDSLFSYSNVQGNLELRKTFKNHLRDLHIFTKVENVMVTSGSQQAIYVLSKIPFPNGKGKVLIEQPTYYGMIKSLEYNEVATVGIKRDINGFDIDELEEIFKNEDIKFFYIQPRFQNPTGFSLSNNQKKGILKLAKKYDVYIIEDDYLADLETNSKNETMYSIDTSDRVVYIKSFSKTLLPGLRVALLILPQSLVNIFLHHKACCDFITNPLSQGALDIYLKSGMYDNHLKNIKKFYSKQMKILKDAVNLEFSSPSHVFVPSTGFFASIEVPNLLEVMDIENMLKSQKVRILNVHNMFLDEYKKNNIFRLSICRVNKQQIYEGIKIITKELNKK
ncbi:GntR family transcriptional regulator [Clostridium carboxidivorans P7]|uniref:Transcriptional regulator, GntR family with aminotransferase domain n=1 Tax=Clostridium carboxidivorans P7 TaxID=536227 RepID=C6PSS1_9CLOT|nr:PLP-dependent aminotransferase family protein [Clostridium carboxidivorans]AKN31629.1 GntR family transcriptional regulator [Clostridium carboxidivorans P7]EET87750.1 transcriptional regulator, GntR family with aminotransferase domain [Clostridium carboxidivorans P7]